MVDFTWFRLMIRGIGVLLLGLALPEFITLAVWFLQRPAIQVGGFSTASDLWSYVPGLIGILLKIGIALYLLFFAEGLIRRCLSDTIGRCPLCQYDLKGRRSGICPECGVDLGMLYPAAQGHVVGPPITIADARLDADAQHQPTEDQRCHQGRRDARHNELVSLRKADGAMQQAPQPGRQCMPLAPS